MYDNFDYQECVHHQVIGDNSTLRHFTTGKLFLGRGIPNGGLRQHMLHNHVQITINDILSADGNHHDYVQDQISKYFIFNAILTIFPKGIQQFLHTDQAVICMNNRRGYGIPKMPQLNILPPKVTQTTTLRPITAEESTIAGSYAILEDIFIRQLTFNPKTDFTERGSFSSLAINLQSHVSARSNRSV